MASLKDRTHRFFLSPSMTRTSRERIFPLTRVNGAGGENGREEKGRLKRPSRVRICSCKLQQFFKQPGGTRLQNILNLFSAALQVKYCDFCPARPTHENVHDFAL